MVSEPQLCDQFKTRLRNLITAWQCSNLVRSIFFFFVDIWQFCSLQYIIVPVAVPWWDHLGLSDFYQPLDSILTNSFKVNCRFCIKSNWTAFGYNHFICSRQLLVRLVGPTAIVFLQDHLIILVAQF
eukprot:TRINITY_DN24007_c0_g1_i2.p1 TRINITY_DN24007_c0_g1~~TRINITY_DN24007_c0_g1_i2.p1  ORF type:complete len:127 (+),score=9.66 TRINITY_DN24007_c0_g1_i2:712-1092(+)